jgi:hypothetical protein
MRGLGIFLARGMRAFRGVSLGPPPVHGPSILLESGSYLLLESGSTILLE